jgi:hypothetical protein
VIKVNNCTITNNSSVYLNSDKIWTIWKKNKLNSGKIWKIWKKIKLNNE